MEMTTESRLTEEESWLLDQILCLTTDIDLVCKQELLSEQYITTLLNCSSIELDPLFNEDIKCDACQKSFKSPQDLRCHYQSAGSAGRYTCCRCSKPFSTRPRLLEHQVTHTKARQFGCIRCGKKFSYYKTLKKHQKLSCQPALDTGSWQLSDKLIKIFQNSAGEKQIKTDQNCKQSRDKCEVCLQNFSSNQSYLEHKMYFESVKTCCLCLKVCGNVSKLVIHQRSHTKEKPHRCELCDKMFSESSSLRKHLLSHGNKNFECSVCLKRFVRKDYLQKHCQTHLRTPS